MQSDRKRWLQLPRAMRKLASESTGSVLLETMRFDEGNRRSFLFRNPLREITARQLDEVPEAFAQVEQALAEGKYVAGLVGYECGYHFEPATLHSEKTRAAAEDGPLIWFGVYERPLIFDHAEGVLTGDVDEERFLHEVPGESVRESRSEISAPCEGAAELGLPLEEYRARVERILDYIGAGDTYQVNFTDQMVFRAGENALALYESLARRQRVAYGAFVNLDGMKILSLSPELFFRSEDGRIVTRPMKGTMRRGLDAHEDALAAEQLRTEAKNHSEHVMIVDLLRNDLGRVCRMGSVQVEELFAVERYETLLQMTSTISGLLRPGVGSYEIFRSLFPCGSVTGAPKIRTMQIIGELECGPRGVYCGSIGYFAPGGRAEFNVAIRTVVLRDGWARMGVGGGIVADSNVADEYAECLLKASFLTERPVETRPDFQLIETMLCDGRYQRLELHLDRLEASAAYFDFAMDRDGVAEQLKEFALEFEAGTRRRVRLTLGRTGQTTLESKEMEVRPESGMVTLSADNTSSTDVFLRHKTTRRERYDQALQRAQGEGLDDVLFGNERGELTEGAISNLFVERGGRLLTPPLSCGVLPGVYRRWMLENDARAEEAVLRWDDLKTADAVYLCNSVRGLRQVRITNNGEGPATMMHGAGIGKAGETEHSDIEVVVFETDANHFESGFES